MFISVAIMDVSIIANHKSFTDELLCHFTRFIIVACTVRTSLNSFHLNFAKFIPCTL